MDFLDGLKAFVATAQSGSFTRAAQQLGISNRLTSKYVAELELRLGARLLQRTTRQVGLTPAGRDLLARAPALLDEFDDLLAAASEGRHELSGTLRVAAPLTFGELYIKDLLARFADHHPDLAIDLRLNDEFVDLASGGYDLAFRIGTPDVASLKVRTLGKMNTRTVASPAYLSRHQAPATPQDLMGHRCILDTNRRAPGTWTFKRGRREISVSPPRTLMVNNARVARAWAIQGRGITLCPEFVLQDDLEKGALVTVLDDYPLPETPVCALYLAGRIVPRKVRNLIDFAIDDIAREGFR